ncbi:cytochrome-c peroxidase [Spartinivicinus poritis]|uniref:Cytochrome c domain-containing protein n=1 Tax=Spartinivicinus poritis TaxID=2994640 RepID=A0ABT5U791_9GAMM|nr:cytochrome c peroxidase [Spartinivicinus sp. A2-2]MDE1461308.1 hypothetical protein [Spartinivicinus sp. A2-2]
MNKTYLAAKVAVICLSVSSWKLFGAGISETPDIILKSHIETHGIQPLKLKKITNPDKIELGRLLFFDKILSGNKDISCATCHHPILSGGDARSLPIGTGGTGLGHTRIKGKTRELIPRNAPEIFNRGMKQWKTMFWDGRVAVNAVGDFSSPAKGLLPDNLDNLLAVQALFPPTSRDEMRGQAGDVDVLGELNELAEFQPAFKGDTSHLPKIWHGITQRVLEYSEYRTLLKKAYPTTPLDEIGIQHLANALAAFEIDGFSFNDAPWDRYVAGDINALSLKEKLGANLFFGKGNCASCHSGPLFTDQKFYNLAVPQIGPGKNKYHEDLGRYHETEDVYDLFAFRTPPLRNVELTGPWMHNGAYNNLRSIIKHHLIPGISLWYYDSNQLPPLERSQLHNNYDLQILMELFISRELNQIGYLSSKEIDLVVAFLKSLTSESARDLEDLIPVSVPSDLPVSD